MTTAPIPFIDLKTQRARMGSAVDEAILKVVNHGAYIMGPEVTELERQLSAFCGARHTLTCANGTDALALVLMAKGVKPGDAVFVPAFTFVATAEVVAWVGATAVFVDVLEDSFNMDPAHLARSIAWAREAGLNPVGVIPVDLFGQPADYTAIMPVAEVNGLWLMSDAAQSFGAKLHNRSVGTYGLATSTSFFPAKPLGCYGDGGAVFTDDDELIEILRSLRIHGQGRDKYENVRIGINGRLDTIQAAVLLEKLKIFPDEIEARDRVAQRYNEALADVAVVPRVSAGATSVWAQYTLLLEDRNKVAAACQKAGVPTAIYYPIPLSHQEGYKHFPSGPGGVPMSEKLAGKVLSLPMHPYLGTDVQDRIIDVVRAAIAS
ncbi:DegT/DnrJ/EryC1/StrS family aminotransferase [Oleomonas cavernae]|uniref:DegT/DnrJ/EryC1/StrS family aminotransferase n=1 Tax=Oleomonas cavernae TaxID=2320859 RepID=A0A418WCM9_9PROT|nr:DegT/DnrJ/EryC1/StrS family aminotransferase [Oleomonas cavernae]RJF87729.1 DegT/DnrJ/EryC1/StrS family aminotransferase [Oleomonas cavernae]